MRLKGYLYIGLVCLFYWVLDSIWSYVSFEHNLKQLIFSEPASYLDTFLLRVPPYQIVSRLMVIALFASFGLLIMQFLIKRQIAERQRKEAHDTFLTVLNSIDATIYVSDLETNEILFMNRFMIESFGDDVTGRICHEVFRENEKVCDHCPNDKLIDAAGNPTGVFVWEGQNPITKAWYVNYDRAIKWIDDRIVHLQIATDITQLKTLQKKQSEAETQLRQSQKMEAIGNLAGGIAHDFNNILSSIIGYTELSLDDVEKGSLIEDNLKEVFKAGKRARDLVKQILAFARQSEDKVKPVQLDAIVNEVLRFIRSSIPTSIEIEKNIVSDSLIMGNATQIHQILMNLCTNAAHAMEDSGGVLRLALEDVKLNKDAPITHIELKPGDYLRLTVSDTGVGIPPEIINSIFEPYFTTKGPGEGTGMGLAVVQGIVESYGGGITVDSAVGKGTTFTSYFPISKKRGTISLQKPEKLPTGTERILFVDDEAALVKMNSQILSQFGYAVITRTSSIEALALFRSKPDDFDLVISDMTMPNMTGDELATELFHIRPDVPVILCTGYSKKISAESVAKIGIMAVIYKPIVKANLAKTVRKVLDQTSIKNSS